MIPDPENGHRVPEEAPEDSAASVEVKYTHVDVDAPPTIAGFVDHFTLPMPTNTIRYREKHSAARVIASTDVQFVLEETADDGKHNITIRRIHDTSEGLRLLRLMYFVVTAFWTGFFFVFCLQVLLFLFLDLAIEVGATDKKEANWGAALGVIFSFVPFVYGLASALVIAGAFIQDAWSGHYLIRNFTLRRFSMVAVEWMFFGAFLGLPLVIMCLMMLGGSDRWWEVASLAWFSCVLAFFTLFAANVIFYELRCCYLVIKNMGEVQGGGIRDTLLRALQMRMIATYSGRKTVRFLAYGSIKDSEYTDKSSRDNKIDGTLRESLSLKAQLSLKAGCGLFNTLEEPKRIFTVDDARDVRPFITYSTWSLEKVFCRPRDSRYIAIVKGPGALTVNQLRSSFVCSILGTFLIFFTVLAALVYLKAPAAATGFLVAIGIVIAWPSMKSLIQLYNIGKDFLALDSMGKADVQGSERDLSINDGESQGVYVVVEKYRVTEPNPRFYWFMFGCEIFFLFVWPCVSLFSVGNWTLGLLFVVVSGITALRYYFNAVVVLEETGSLDLAVEQDKSGHRQWRDQSRVNEIVGNITAGRSQGVWIAVLGVLGFIFLALALLAGSVGEGNLEAAAANKFPPYVTLDTFEYIQRDSLRYPTCELTNDLGSSPLRSMADYTFLSGLAYRPAGNDTQFALDEWFPEGAVEQVDTVEQFRSENNISSAVSFKLVTFPNSGNFAYEVIRGTQNNWDMLTDAQLWSAAALMQVHRAILPLGEIWTPIMNQLISAITKVESESIARVSFYKDTTRFARYLVGQTPDTYRGVAVTGHSLGGGLSIITGAQVGIPAVALSGPNARLSGRSFDPKVSEEALNSKTFNIIPERDVVPLIDDPAQNWQSIRCEAGSNDFAGCHDSTRSLCEVIFTCGTNGRPVLCDCVGDEPDTFAFGKSYGYPEPTPKDGVTISFREACAQKKAQLAAQFGL